MLNCVSAAEYTVFYTAPIVSVDLHDQMQTEIYSAVKLLLKKKTWFS